MKIFNCDYCGQLVYFENSLCTGCGHMLGFCPDTRVLCAWEPVEENIWRSPSPVLADSLYRPCLHYTREHVCNWMVPADSTSPFCLSCRFNLMIPDLSVPENKTYWHRLEIAKRRLLYTLLSLNLTLISREEDPEYGLAFEFMAETEFNTKESKPVMTGHHKGVITMNIAEANDVVRERMRLDMNERYRTLLGHFRHEIGHYYWFIFIREKGFSEAFRDLFGDERENYTEALEIYYAGQKADHPWWEQYVSAYASAHPWEDWAETWAHYLHIMDAYETAHAWGLTIKPKLLAVEKPDHKPVIPGKGSSFDEILENWQWISCALNSFNRSMGLKDLYPFVLSSGVQEKLRFIHDRTMLITSTLTEA